MGINDTQTAGIIKKRRLRINPDSYLVHVTIPEDNIEIEEETAELFEEPGIDPEEERKAHEEEEQKRMKELLGSEYAKGYEEGRKKALEEMENDFKNKLSDTIIHLSELTNVIKNEFDDFKYCINQEVIRLSISIAEKILKREVKIDDKTIVAQVSECIRKIIGVENIIIFVNPEDERVLKLFKSDFYHTFESLKDITIQGHERIDRGSCRIESNMGNVDARFATQMKIIEDTLLEKITEERANEDVPISPN
jgi:flagellar assembly protein FliH